MNIYLSRCRCGETFYNPEEEYSTCPECRPNQTYRVPDLLELMTNPNTRGY